METPCVVCEEVCPTTPKAIGTYDEAFTRWDGKTVTLNKPYMRPELCIGCGICQKECPVVDDAAVYVTAIGESRSDDRTLLLTGKTKPPEADGRRAGRRTTWRSTTETASPGGDLLGLGGAAAGAALVGGLALPAHPGAGAQEPPLPAGAAPDAREDRQDRPDPPRRRHGPRPEVRPEARRGASASA